MSWILKRVGPPSVEVTCDKLRQHVSETKLAVAYFGDSGEKEFKDVFLGATKNPTIGDKYQFYHTSDKECATAFGARTLPAVAVFRTFEPSPVLYQGALWDSNELAIWMSEVSVPDLIDFSEDYIEQIFGQRKAAIFLFRSPEQSSSDFVATFTAAATALKGEILFVVSGITEGIQSRLAEFIGVDATPALRILDPNNNMNKYTYPGQLSELTQDSLKRFISDFKAGHLKPFLKSQDVPADNSQPLKVLVGTTFNKLVVDSDDEVFVKFHAPWCGHCKKMAPDWEQLAAELQHVSGLVIAEFDATLNEVDGLEVQGFPTLKFYALGQKSEPIPYDDERDIDHFRSFLKEHSKVY